MLGKRISKIMVGAGLLGMLFVYGARGDDKGIPGPIDSIEDLQDAGKMLFKLADTNNDNRISQKEAIDAGNLVAGGFFFRADANGDGTVTAAEAQAAREDLFNQKPLLRLIFQRSQEELNRQGSQNVVNQSRESLTNLLDTNHDGNYSSGEVRQAIQTSVQSLFLMADKNGDGQLDPSEVNQSIVDTGRAAVQVAFNAADTDKNGAVSQAEFDKAVINPAHVVFRILDANNDNQISADELRSGTQVLAKELGNLWVPEPSNSLTNRVEQQQQRQKAATGEAAPLQPAVSPSGAIRTAPAPGTAPAPAPATAPVIIPGQPTYPQP